MRTVTCDVCGRDSVPYWEGFREVSATVHHGPGTRIITLDVCREECATKAKERITLALLSIEWRPGQ